MPGASLTIEDVNAMLRLLPPPPPDQEIHYHPSTGPEFKKLVEANRSPFGGLLIPMSECCYLPAGTVALVTYERIGRCRVIKSADLFRC